MDKELQAQIDVCDENFFKNLGNGDDSKDQNFILGLPRAGSTLIEQILASHSMVDGTLELPNILSMAQGLREMIFMVMKEIIPKAWNLYSRKENRTR